LINPTILKPAASLEHLGNFEYFLEGDDPLKNAVIQQIAPTAQQPTMEPDQFH